MTPIWTATQESMVPIESQWQSQQALGWTDAL